MNYLAEFAACSEIGNPPTARSKLGASPSAGHAAIPYGPGEWSAPEIPALIDEREATENGDRNGSGRGFQDAG